MDLKVETKIRADKLVAQKLIISRNKAKQLLLNNLIKINQQIVNDPAKKFKPTNLIEVIKVKVVEQKLPLIQVISFPLEEKNGIFTFEYNNDNKIYLLYENQDFIIINKCRGVMSHFSETKKAFPNLVDLLIQAHIKLSGGDSFRKGIVHRLDENTTGLMILTKNKDAYDSFKKMFLERLVQREYTALVQHNIRDDEFIIKGNIIKNYKKSKMVIDYRGKEAQTYVKVLERFTVNNIPLTLIQCKLYTGRTHQIRVHLSHINHPIVGDNKYHTIFKDKPLHLHSSLLSFKYKNKNYTFTSINKMIKIL